MTNKIERFNTQIYKPQDKTLFSHQVALEPKKGDWFFWIICDLPNDGYR